ncbi:DUF7665 family protein [Bradyrhizobium sp.]
MLAPDQRLFEADLSSVEYRDGVAKGLWALAETDALPNGAAWPNVYFWMAAARRTDAPDRYYVASNLSGYRSVPPTGTFWDPIRKAALELGKRPKGKPGSRFAMVFRTDWENGRAFYHPYDRLAAQGHGEWPKEQPHLIWTSSHTIVDYLEEFQSLLTCGDYLGV